MPSPERPLWEPDLAAFSMGNEIRACLRDLIAAARLDWTPSGFTEKHLVDELAINKWRQLRVLSMQNAIYRHEQAAGMANNPKVQGQPSQPPEPGGDMYFYAMCHTPERHGVVLTALARLETRYHRQFCQTLSALVALRQFTGKERKAQ